VTTSLSVLLKDVEDRRQIIAEALIAGSAKDFAEYKSMTGEIRGLSLAHSIVTDLVRKLENDDE
jgi:hypothetical protein